MKDSSLSNLILEVGAPTLLSQRKRKLISSYNLAQHLLLNKNYMVDLKDIRHIYIEVAIVGHSHLHQRSYLQLKKNDSLFISERILQIA